MVNIQWEYTPQAEQVRNLLDYLNPENPFYEKIHEDRELLERFCAIYHTNLEGIAITVENGHPEPMYFFDDNLGGYSRNGLKDSVAEVLHEL